MTQLRTRQFIEFRITGHRQFVIPTPEKIKRAKPHAPSRLMTAVGVYHAVLRVAARIRTLIDDTAIEISDGKMASLESVANVVGVDQQVMADRMQRRRAEVAQARAALSRDLEHQTTAA
jgi:hypothetical protein